MASLELNDRNPAGISCWVGLALYITGGLLNWTPLTATFLVCASLLAIALGIIGWRRGIASEASGTVRMGMLGVAINSILLTMLLLGFLS